MPQLNESNAGQPPEPEKIPQPIPWETLNYQSRPDPEKAARRSIAGWFILVFVAVVAGQYALVAWFTFAGNADGLVHIEKLFSAVLPVVSGLVGAAATYYFTRERT